MFHLIPYWWFRRTIHIPEFVRFYKNRGFYLEGCLTVRISGGVTHRRRWGYSLDVTPRRYSDVPEVLDVQEVASEEVMIVPDEPIATKIPFP